jgi:hypothetical protein
MGLTITAGSPARGAGGQLASADHLAASLDTMASILHIATQQLAATAADRDRAPQHRRRLELATASKGRLPDVRTRRCSRRRSTPTSM